METDPRDHSSKKVLPLQRSLNIRQGFANSTLPSSVTLDALPSVLFQDRKQFRHYHCTTSVIYFTPLVLKKKKYHNELVTTPCILRMG